MMSRFFKCFVVLGLLFYSLFVSAQNDTNKSTVVEYQLENGLKILVKPIFRAPVVSSQLWYKVGSSYEHSGISGISHMLEHMMFKGTKKYPANALSSIVSKRGGNQNAFTSRDYTAYYQNISQQHLAKMLELEADRMQGIEWDEEAFKKETKVIMEERRLRTDDSPDNRLYELFFGNTFALNPYRIPIIGWMDDIKNYKMHDAQAWFDQWYAPNNATLVVVGAVKPERVRQLAEQFFAHIPARDIAEIKPRIEPSLSIEKRIEMEAEVNYSYMMMGYKVPSLSFILEHSHDEQSRRDVFALEVISAMLDSGGSSRLSTELIRKQRVASQSGAFYYPYARLETVFVLDASTAEGYDHQDIEQALSQQIELLKTEEVSDSELNKIKNQLKASRVYQQDSLFNQGYELGALESIGLSWRDGQSYLQDIEQITAEDILRVSNKYFVAENRSVAILKPQKREEK